MKQKMMKERQRTQFTLLLLNKMKIMKELMMKWKQKFQYSLLLLIWRDIKVKVEKNKNDGIDEETSEVENPDSMGH